MVYFVLEVACLESEMIFNHLKLCWFVERSFYRPQVYVGSDLWVLMSLSEKTFC